VVAFDVVTTKWKVRIPERRPTPPATRDTLTLLRARHSCRSFQTRPLENHDREALLGRVAREIARAPIGEIRPRLEYIAAPLTVWPTVNASEFLVAIVPKSYARMAGIDVGRTLERVVIDATRMGIATCWIGPGADQKSVVAHLGERFDPERDHVICVCAIGYRSRYVPLFLRIFNHQVSTTRRPLDALFFSDAKLERPIDPTAGEHDAWRPVYEACRWSPSSYNGQTTRAFVEHDAKGQLKAIHFFASTASRYYAPVAVGIWCANWEMACEALGVRGRFEPAGAPDDALPHLDVTWRPLDRTPPSASMPTA